MQSERYVLIPADAALAADCLAASAADRYVNTAHRRPVSKLSLTPRKASMPSRIHLGSGVWPSNS